MRLSTQNSIDRKNFDYSKYEIKTFWAQMTFSNRERMNPNLTDEFKRCIITREFLDTVAENIDISEEVGDYGALRVRAELRLAVKR